jgi:hypothetical protein
LRYISINETEEAVSVAFVVCIILS